MNQHPIPRVLTALGVLLVAFFVVVILFDIFPFKLLQPDWIVVFALSLVNNAAIPLVGIAFVHLSAFLAAGEPVKAQLRVARLASVLALLYLFLIPYVAFAAWRNITNLAAINKQQIELINKKADQILRGIQRADTFAELQSNMTRLQGPSLSNDVAAVDLNTLKKQLVDIVKTSRDSAPAKLKTTSSPDYRAFYQRLLRIASMALLACFGFGLLAWNPVREENIFGLYFKSIGLFGITPNVIYKSLGNAIGNYLIRRKETAELRKRRRAALLHQRQMNRLEAGQSREQKRLEIQEQKRLLKQRKERERMIELEKKMERKRELEQERQRREN